MALLRRTAICLLEKMGAHETKAGQFGDSFEKVVRKIDEANPRRRIMDEFRGSGFVLEEKVFGEVPDDEQKQQVQHEMWGKESTTLADKKRDSFFGREKYMEMVERARLKAKKLRQTQKFDPDYLKTSKEPQEYYYSHKSLHQKQLHAYQVGAFWVVVMVIVVMLFRRYLRSLYTWGNPAEPIADR